MEARSNSERGNKGQVLVILAVITVLVLFLLKVETAYTGSYDLSGTDSLNTFENIRNELKRSGQITIWEDNYSAAYEFSKFLTEKKDSEILYSISDFSGTGLNVTVVNFLGETLQQINVSQNLTGETDTIPLLADGESDWVNFTWSPGPETLFEINITYVAGSGITNHTFTAKAGPDRYVTVFHDLKLNYGKSYTEDKFSVSGVVI